MRIAVWTPLIRYSLSAFSYPMPATVSAIRYPAAVWTNYVGLKKRDGLSNLEFSIENGLSKQLNSKDGYQRLEWILACSTWGEMSF